MAVLHSARIACACVAAVVFAASCSATRARSSVRVRSAPEPRPDHELQSEFVLFRDGAVSRVRRGSPFCDVVTQALPSECACNDVYGGAKVACGLELLGASFSVGVDLLPCDSPATFAYHVQVGSRVLLQGTAVAGAGKKRIGIPGKTCPTRSCVHLAARPGVHTHPGRGICPRKHDIDVDSLSHTRTKKLLLGVFFHTLAFSSAVSTMHSSRLPRHMCRSCFWHVCGSVLLGLSLNVPFGIASAGAYLSYTM